MLQERGGYERRIDELDGQRSRLEAQAKHLNTNAQQIQDEHAQLQALHASVIERAQNAEVHYEQQIRAGKASSDELAAANARQLEESFRTAQANAVRQKDQDENVRRMHQEGARLLEDQQRAEAAIAGLHADIALSLIHISEPTRPY